MTIIERNIWRVEALRRRAKARQNQRKAHLASGVPAHTLADFDQRTGTTGHVFDVAYSRCMRCLTPGMEFEDNVAPKVCPGFPIHLTDRTAPC